MGVFTFRRKSQWPQVLEWINEKRAILGLEPLREVQTGVRKNSNYCPIAKSLSNGHRVTVGGQWTTVFKDGKQIHLWRNPVFIAEFIMAFDRGLIPDLNYDE